MVLEDAEENPHLVGLAALRGEARLAGLALVEMDLDLGGGRRDARRSAVDDGAEGGTVAFSEVVTRTRWPKLL
jgi:hypothetical protein